MQNTGRRLILFCKQKNMYFIPQTLTPGNQWLIHVDVWLKPVQHGKAIILQSKLIGKDPDAGKD